jgi:hypothetical protein
MNQKSLFGVEYEVEKKDIQYTPADVAEYVVNFFHPSGRILDPCKGDGAFLRYLPGADWCELREGRDFFEYQKRVDWIISNPPYSVFSEWLDHSFEIADNIVYLIPVNKPFNSYAMMRRIAEYGGIKHILVVAPGSKLNFSIGFAIGAVHFRRNYTGEIGLSFMPCNNRLQATPHSRPQIRTN